jgi:hypothetical protein
MATYYFRNAGVNFGDAANWSISSGGPPDGAVPNATHDAIFDANSGPCTINTSIRACKTLTCTGYTNAFTMSAVLNVSGNITFGASMGTSTGASTLAMIVTGTLTSNGHQWATPFQFAGTSQTYTLGSNVTLDGQLTCLGTTAITINDNTLTCNNGAIFTTATGGTTTIELKGGNWSGTCNNTMNLNSTGTITIVNNIGRGSGTLTWVAGTINNSGNYSLSYSGGSVNVGNNILWNNITMGGGTITLVSSLYASGNLITGNGGIWNGLFTIYCTGITQNNTSINLYGSVTVELTGTGTWQTGTINTSWGFDTVINCNAFTPGNTLTINTGRIFGSTLRVATLTYTSGTVNCLGGMTFYNCILATNGMIFNDVTLGIGGAGVNSITLSNNLSIAGNCTIGGNANLSINGNTANVGGSLINAMSAGSGGGTTVFNMNGTGNIQTTGTPANWANPITINSPSGTITWSGTNAYNGNLTYTAGTIVSTGSILNRSSGTMTINAVGFNLATLNLTGFCYFLGTNGFTISTLNCSTTGVHSVWKSGNEYTISTAFNSGQADGINRITYTSSLNKVFTGAFSGTQLVVSAVQYGTIAIGDEIFGTGISQGRTITSLISGTLGGIGTYGLSGGALSLTSRTVVSTANSGSQPKITLQNSATQNLYYSNALDIDSTGGQTIWTFGSNLLRAFNWNIGTKPAGFSRAWVR